MRSTTIRNAPRLVLAVVLLAAGVVWCVRFPKRADLEPDMVFSVCLGVGLISSGLLIAYAKRMKWSVLVTSLLLLWSLLANAYLVAENVAMSRILLDHASRDVARPR